MFYGEFVVIIVICFVVMVVVIEAFVAEVDSLKFFEVDFRQLL